MYKFSHIPVDTPKIKTKNRTIKTKIPSPETVSILEDCMTYEPASMNDQLPVAWDKAYDFNVYDKSGNKWIDFTSSIFVTNVGHSNKDVQKAILKTCKKQLLNSYYYPTKERNKLSKLIIQNSPKNLDKVLFLSTGSESVEAAIKMSLLYTGRKKILSFDQGFHGKTMGSSMACGKGNDWVPVKSFVKHLPFPNEWGIKSSPENFFKQSVKNLKPNEYAAFIIEPYQGWSASFLPTEYAQKLESWCKSNGILLIVDEIQSGFGRTGKFFAFEHFKISPDIITCAKGISSSLPLSCVISKSSIVDTSSSFNSTHGSNPAAVAASTASINYLIKNKLVEQSKNKGDLMLKFLKEWQKEQPHLIKRISCRGLLASVFINSPDGNDSDFVDKIIETAMRKGLLSVRTMSGTLKIGPPLTITKSALIEGLEILKESLEECLGM